MLTNFDRKMSNHWKGFTISYNDCRRNNVDSILFIYLFLECEAAGTGEVGSFFLSMNGG